MELDLSCFEIILIASINSSSFSAILLLSLDQAKVASDLTADFLQVFELSLELFTSISLVIQLSFQLRNVRSATHLANLRWSWLHFWGRFKGFLQITHFILGLLRYVSFFGILIWIWNVKVVKITGNQCLLLLVHWLSNNWWLWLDWSSSHTTALLTWPDRFEAWEGSLAKHRFLGRGLIRAKLLVESLKSSPAELTFSVSIIAIGTWCLVESSHGTILASSLGPLRTSVLPLVNKSTLSSIPKVAISILLLLHLGHLSSNLRNRVLSEPALVCLNALFHLLGFEAVHNRKIRLDLKT